MWISKLKMNNLQGQLSGYEMLIELLKEKVTIYEKRNASQEKYIKALEETLSHLSEAYVECYDFARQRIKENEDLRLRIAELETEKEE